ncbi:MAG: hypothetical protein M1549_01495 [Candidatus Dependentiae bacterium]|nr:hypothetical protein [Candidatus Dependentiae bacterium]
MRSYRLLLCYLILFAGTTTDLFGQKKAHRDQQIQSIDDIEDEASLDTTDKALLAAILIGATATVGGYFALKNYYGVDLIEKLQRAFSSAPKTDGIKIASNPDKKADPRNEELTSTQLVLAGVMTAGGVAALGFFIQQAYQSGFSVILRG